jgi:chromosome partitioning protein
VESALPDEPSNQTILNRAIRQLPQRWDVLLIDTPPGLGLLTSSALVACQEVIIPCEASALSLAGVSMLTAHVQKIRQQLNPKLVVSGVLPSRVDRRKKLHVQSVLRLREMYGDRVFTTVIRENIRVQEAPNFGQPVIVYSPDSAGSADFRALAGEVMARGNQMSQCPES